MYRRQALKSIVAAAATTVLPATQHAAGSRKYKILITGGHPGDPEYGCGGTIARLTNLGHEVVLLYMNDGAWETSATVRLAEAKKACEILKARPAYANQKNGHSVVDNERYTAFEKILESENPDAVITHWPIDTHPDHRAITNLTFEAWKQLKHKFALYYYEVGEDTQQFPAPTHYVDIASVVDIKKAACYAHASQTPDHYYPIEDTMAAFRGLESGTTRAEAYLRQVGNQYDVLSQLGLA
jgi:LmbE family N-acetylglucosaminyl deacetylase